MFRCGFNRCLVFYRRGLESFRAMKCPYCGKQAEWVSNSVIYGRPTGKSHMIYLCRPCDAYVGCHKNSRKALGTMANAHLRALRATAHFHLDPIWKNGLTGRSQLYAMLASHFKKEVHIGSSDEKTCAEIVVWAGQVRRALESLAKVEEM